MKEESRSSPAYQGYSSETPTDKCCILSDRQYHSSETSGQYIFPLHKFCFFGFIPLGFWSVFEMRWSSPAAVIQLIFECSPWIRIDTIAVTQFSACILLIACCPHFLSKKRVTEVQYIMGYVRPVKDPLRGASVAQWWKNTFVGPIWRRRMGTLNWDTAHMFPYCRCNSEVKPMKTLGLTQESSAMFASLTQ